METPCNDNAMPTVEAAHEVVREIVTNSAVWPHLSEDGQRPEDYHPSESSEYVIRMDGRVYVEIRRISLHTFDVHIAALRKSRDVQLFAEAVIDYLAGERKARKLTTSIRHDNKAAILFVKRLGFVQEGRITSCLEHGGEMKDLLIMGKVL